MRKLAFAAAIALMPVGAFGQDFDAGLSAFNRGDYAQAFQELQPLADQGDAFAQAILGVMYEHGTGVPEDDAEAVRWYRLAADQGYAFAQYNLGSMYANGNGVLKDKVVAHMWLNIGSANGNQRAAGNRNLIESDMTAEQIAEATQRARACMASSYADCD